MRQYKDIETAHDRHIAADQIRNQLLKLLRLTERGDLKMVRHLIYMAIMEATKTLEDRGSVAPGEPPRETDSSTAAPRSG